MNETSSLTLKQVAEIFDVAPRTVTSWLKQGIPYTADGPGKPNRFSLGAVIRWGVTEGKFSGMPRADGTDLLDEKQERAKLARAQRKLSELKRQKLEGELLPAGEVRRAWEKVVIAARAKLLLLPNFAAAWVGLDEKELRKEMTLRLEEAMHELARGLDVGPAEASEEDEADEAA